MIDFDFGLGEQTDLLRAQVARFAAEHVAPLAAEIDRSNEFPRLLWPELGRLGLLGITVEVERGGAGGGYLDHVVAMEELSRASAAVGLSYAAHSNLCVNQLRLWATPEQCDRFLPGLIDGSAVGALAMSEPQAGSDVLAMRTTASRCAGGRRVNGTKMWITNGPHADVVIVYAVEQSGAGRAWHRGAHSGARHGRFLGRQEARQARYAGLGYERARVHRLLRAGV